MRITGSDGFSGPYALGTYTIARGGTYGPAEIGDRSNHPNATGDENGPTFAGAPLRVATIEPVTIDGVHLKSTVPGVVCIYAMAGASVTVRNCHLDAYVRNGVAAWFNSSTDSPSAITFENNHVHGGTIAVRSEGEGLGATFVVRLPLATLRATPTRDLAEGQATRASPQWERPPEIAGLRVLVVDDERDARDLIATVLEYCGATVEHAGSVTEGLEKLERWRPDILLSDIGMPDEDGYALIRQVRSRPLEGGGSIPVASLTAYAGAEDRRRALHAGFNMHVAKPIEPAELVAVVANLARLARLLR